MMRISNYSLNYARQLAQGKMTIFQFLTLCRELNVDGASLHLRDLPEVSTGYLKQIRRAYLEQQLAMTVFTVSTNFGLPENRHKQEFETALQAIRVATFLGAPLLRMFPGYPPSDAERTAAFERSAATMRKVCEEAAQVGLPVGLQNHNHGALCRTGDEVLRYMKLVNHPNFVFLLDTGQWAGSRGASATPPPDLRNADYLQSIRQTASLARYVRVKFYNPAPDGSEPWLDYNQIFDILRGVHYQGVLDIVYEPGKAPGDAGEDISTAMPRIVKFLRSKIQMV